MISFICPWVKVGIGLGVGVGIGVGVDIFGVGFGVGLGVGIGVSTSFGVGLGVDEDVAEGLSVEISSWAKIGFIPLLKIIKPMTDPKIKANPTLNIWIIIYYPKI